MSLSATVNKIYSVPGITLQGVLVRSASGGVPPQDVSLPAADAGTLTTRTSDTAGTFTATASHSIETGDIIDLFWDGGVARKATVGTVAGLAIPFTGATGDVLPAQDTAMNVDERVVLDVDFDGDLLECIGALMSKRGLMHFEENGGTSIFPREMLAGEPWEWIADTGLSNPLTGNPVGVIAVSNGDATSANTFQLGGVYNSDS